MERQSKTREQVYKFCVPVTGKKAKQSQDTQNCSKLTSALEPQTRRDQGASNDENYSAR